MMSPHLSNIILLLMNKEVSIVMNRADKYLAGRRIIKSIETYQEAARMMSEWDAFRELETLKSTYGYIRHYFLTGVPDHNRHSAVEDIEKNIHRLADSLKRSAMIDSEGVYFSDMRIHKIHPFNLSNLLSQYKAIQSQLTLAEAAEESTPDLIARRYNLLSQIFSGVMVSYSDKQDLEIIRDILTEAGDTYDRAIILQVFYALVMSLFAWFDIEKFSLLLSLAEGLSLKTSLKYRARVALILCIALWENEIRKYPDVWKQLLFTTDYLGNELQAPIKTIAGTIDTDRISVKMKEEVIPEIMKMSPEMLKNMRNQEIDPEDMDFNPEWQEMLEKSGIGRKMEEISEMVAEGGDVMMITFSQLKKFPFFNRPGNWFLPYDSSNPELGLNPEVAILLQHLIESNNTICDADKYSLALALNQLPEAQRKAMVSQLQAQINQLKEMKSGDAPASEDSSANQEMIRCLRDLYRFFVLSSNKAGFRNPFAIRPDYNKIESLKSVMDEDGFDRILAEFYFKRKYFADSLSLLESITSEKGSDDPMIWQKLGFCYQKTGDFKSAKKAYMTAELFGDSSIWLHKHLASVNRRLGLRSEALEYYEKALTLDPDNKTILMNIVELQLEDYDNHINDVIRHLYHLNYMDPDDRRVNQALGWARMLGKEYDKSEAIWQKIIADNPGRQDWLNAGHVALLSDNIQEALRRYRNSYQINPNDFCRFFEMDIPVLLKLGADQVGLSMIYEAAQE